MPDPTIIIALTASGLVVEAPGANGMRAKIEGLTLDDLPFEIRASLIEQQDRLKAAPKPSPAPRVDYVDPQIERERSAILAGQERRKRHMEWIETLGPDQRAYQLEKLADADRRIREQADDRARQIWLGLAKDHDIDLANRVISDPNRRPRRKVVVVTSNGQKLISPRTGATSDTKPETGPRFRGDKNGVAVKIDL